MDMKYEIIGNIKAQICVMKQTIELVKKDKEKEKLFIENLDSVQLSFFDKYNNYSNSIYIIESPSALNINLDTIKSVFSRNKKEHDNQSYHISKINDQHFNNNSTTLYVGSKQKDLRTRFLQHLGLIDRKKRSVFSLYMKDWWDNKGVIEITVYRFKEKVTHNQLQIIEDAIWNIKKPLFGKKGGNSNSQ